MTETYVSKTREAGAGGAGRDHLLALFGIHETALEVLARVYDDVQKVKECDLGRVSFAPWYNGREKGVVVEVVAFREDGSFCRSNLLVTFGECRESGDVFVDVWEIERSILNPATVANFTEAAYKNRRTFSITDPKQFETAALYVLDAVDAYLGQPSLVVEGV